MTTTPRMYYFGPWDQPGHYLHDESGRVLWREEEIGLPWTGGQIDGRLQPGCVPGGSSYARRGPEVEGDALLHRKAGWTAISFWDRSVDTRGACNSTYMAEGEFTFEQMVEMAKARFAVRWNRMKFEVRESQEMDLR